MKPREVINKGMGYNTLTPVSSGTKGTALTLIMICAIATQDSFMNSLKPQEQPFPFRLFISH